MVIGFSSTTFEIQTNWLVANLSVFNWEALLLLQIANTQSVVNKIIYGHVNGLIPAKSTLSLKYELCFENKNTYSFWLMIIFQALCFEVRTWNSCFCKWIVVYHNDKITFFGFNRKWQAYYFIHYSMDTLNINNICFFDCFALNVKFWFPIIFHLRYMTVCFLMDKRKEFLN